MSGIKYFIWMAGQSFDVFVYLGWPFVFSLFLVLLCTALGFDIYRKRLRPADICISLSPLLVTVGILAAGVVFKANPAYNYVPLAGLVLCLVACIAVLVWRRRVWPTVLMFSISILWYTLICAFVAGMSIADDWL